MSDTIRAPRPGDDPPRCRVCALHTDLELAVVDLREGQQQILDAIGVLTARVSEVDAIATKLARPIFAPERSNTRLSLVHDGEAEDLRAELAEARKERDEAKAALTEERRRTHSDWRELNRTKLERWKYILLAIALVLGGGGGTKLLEFVFK